MRLAGIIIAIAVGVTSFRLVILAVTPTDLFFDEAQYWAWGNTFAWGYFSKPPLIGWVIGSVTALSGDDGTFWVRAAAPVFHGATAVVIGLWLANSHKAAALWGTALYLSMPILAIGSWMISTDTIMAPFLAAALWAWWRHLSNHTLSTAVLAGLLAGIATLAKYAGAYFWIAVLVSAFSCDLRPRAQGIGAALITFLIVIAPNLAWNLQNGLVTLSHTAGNARWADEWSLNWSGLLVFFTAQAAVIGPIFLIVWLAALWKPKDRLERYLLSASVPILCLVCLQALLARANANWAFAAYLSAAPLVALRLVRTKRQILLISGLLVNSIIVIAVSALIVWPSLAPQISDRYTGRSDLMREILLAANGAAIMADERQILADLTYAAHIEGAASTIFAAPHRGPPRHWYDMVSELPSDVPVLYFTDGAGPQCLEQDILPERSFAPTSGAYNGRQMALFRVPAECR